MSKRHEKPGESDETSHKLHTLAGIAGMHTKICNGRYMQHMPYWYFDLNAGYGHGSPATVYPFLVSSSLDWTMVLCEHNPETFNDLSAVWDIDNPRIILRCEDNANIARQYAKTIPALSNGLVFHDPNGVDDLNLDALRPFSQGRLDIVIYYSATAHKRYKQRACRVQTILDSGIKRYWLVRQPRDAWQWAFLIGTNWEGYPEWRKHHIFRATSPEGRGIIQRLHYTKAELQTIYQPRLMEDV